MTSPNPDLSTLPQNLQDIINAAVANALAQQAAASQPKELTEHEKLLDHVQRAVNATTVERSQLASDAVNFHVLSALSYLIKEVENHTEALTSHLNNHTASVGTPASVAVAATSETEGAL